MCDLELPPPTVIFGGVAAQRLLGGVELIFGLDSICWEAESNFENPRVWEIFDVEITGKNGEE